MTGLIIFGVALLVLSYIICAAISVEADENNTSAFLGIIFLCLITLLAVLCFLSAGRAKIETHEIQTPTYLIQEVNKDGKVTKDTSYIYSFPLHL